MTIAACIAFFLFVVSAGLDVSSTYFALKDNPHLREVGPVARRLFGDRPEFWQLVALKGVGAIPAGVLWLAGGPAPVVAYCAVLTVAQVYLAVKNSEFIRF